MQLLPAHHFDTIKVRQSDLQLNGTGKVTCIYPGNFCLPNSQYILFNACFYSKVACIF